MAFEKCSRVKLHSDMAGELMIAGSQGKLKDETLTAGMVVDVMCRFALETDGVDRSIVAAKSGILWVLSRELSEHADLVEMVNLSEIQLYAAQVLSQLILPKRGGM
jgi:hypothetical protein